MEKQKKWQLALIVTVLALTLYNILPTVFYYTKPLSSPIDEQRAKGIAHSITNRVNSLETDSQEWLNAFCKQLGVKPLTLTFNPATPGFYQLTFKTDADAELFAKFLPKAGNRIPFAPSKLQLSDIEGKTVTVKREINVHLQTDGLYQFAKKFDDKGQVTPEYRELVYDRVKELALGFGSEGTAALELQAIGLQKGEEKNELVLALSQELNELASVFGLKTPLSKRLFANTTKISAADPKKLLDQFTTEAKKLQETAQNKQDIAALERAQNLIKQNKSLFDQTVKPLQIAAIEKSLKESEAKVNPKDLQQVISLQGTSPFVEALVIDWGNDRILLKFYKDVDELRLRKATSESDAVARDRLNLLLISDIARVSRMADESIVPDNLDFSIALNTLTDTKSFLKLDLATIAKQVEEQVKGQIATLWKPSHQDLSATAYPLREFEEYKSLSLEDKQLGLVLYAPVREAGAPPQGFRKGSVYVIAKGLVGLAERYKDLKGESAQNFFSDAQELENIMRKNGFIAYSGALYGIDPQFKKDYIFELDDYFGDLLLASRENFVAKGSKRFAVLDFTDVEQRILTENKIEDKIQDELVTSEEEYRLAKVDLNGTNKFLVPPPTKSPLWQNILLSTRKYFRGDSDKVLKLGLDLSGGKTVRIGLKDQNNRPVTNPDDLKQALNELYTRVNKLGVSETTIRVENENIVLDFPGSQNLSAQDLIKASAMYFYIVNETYSLQNPELQKSVQEFLQGVWNEAVVTNRKDIDSINEIAWQHLGGQQVGEWQTQPRSEGAKILYEHGLRLADVKKDSASSNVDDTLSRIVMYPGSDYTDWHGQTHPLMITFFNYALEGSSLQDVIPGYDPEQGNVLNFGVKRQGGTSGSPRDNFHDWTSLFAQDKIIGTPKESASKGFGWRMAVVLNDRVITAPTLNAALRDGGSISGRFSQREVNKLAADLKAGSLSFTPKILSEQNVSAELGKEERSRGIIASLIALVLVVAAMVGYYRFAGVVASIAVLFNLLIMWGVLQNLDAALTLPGIAAIVLTIGMAVDANVLVFERVREEFKISGRLPQAMQAGYSKAFTAILDSNLTTILAALILIQFDSGPIKGFAVTLIVGIASSMFTALFMTRYFFAGWVQNPKNDHLTMSEWIHNTNFDFLGKAKAAIIASALIMAVGGYCFYDQFRTLFGMDFTGGYSLQLDVEDKPGNPSYRMEAINALLSAGATPNDIDVRELSRPNQLLIQLGMGIEEKGHPFYQMPEFTNPQFVANEYERNPRIVWVIDALKKSGLVVQSSQLSTLDQQWNAMGAQFSDTMRNNAILALALAFLGILIYITVRFEFKYAIAAVLGLAHDVFITLGVFAIIHKFGFPVQIDLQVVAAIMTIIGYSLNDTIIVFDRIREDVRVNKKWAFKDVVNHALNVTLSRTLMTSGTTLLVLIALVTLGGQSIFAFSLVMTIGVFVGTLSSLFIASPAMLYFHDREESGSVTARHA